MSAEVSRGTLGPEVRPMLFRKYLVEANRDGVKSCTRRVLTASNSVVTPGEFSGLDLDTGRARPKAPHAELRAQCTFASGRVRVVSVLSKVRPGDLFWIKVGRFAARVQSDQTIEITRVRVARVRDMSGDELWREGAAYIPQKLRRGSLNPRDWFGRLWNDINGDDRNSWEANPWVWVYDYRVHAENVDTFLAR